MKVLILGAGVIGVTTAFLLKKKGCDVEIIDRNKTSALECSFSNGGQLSYCHAEPWASPSSLKKALTWLGRSDAPLLFRLQADHNMWLWNLKFLRNCTNERVSKNTITMLRLALYSREKMHEIENDISFKFDYHKTGKLFVFKTKNDMDSAIEHSKFQEELGAKYRHLSTEELLEREPALHHMKSEIIGGISNPLDETGDTFKFTKNLSKHLSSNGVTFHYNTNITSIKTNRRSIVSVETDNGSMEADIYVVALGAYSPLLLRKIGINAPIYPMKGYSISIQASDEAPLLSITDPSRKIVCSRLGEIFRVVGTAEFAGYNQDITKERIDMLKNFTRESFPDCGDIDNADEWACLRPQTPDGPPVIGKCKYDNMFLNTGHGSLGWTQAAGSAGIVADIIDGKNPEIDMCGLTLERF